MNVLPEGARNRRDSEKEAQREGPGKCGPSQLKAHKRQKFYESEGGCLTIEATKRVNLYMYQE